MRKQIDLNSLSGREDEAMSRGFFGGVMFGALLGIVLTLVFAPRRGDETRAALVGAADDVKTRATDIVHHVNPFSSDHADASADSKTVRAGDGEAAIEREFGVDNS